MDSTHVLMNLLLYVFLPLWGIAGFVDWLCHRATHIESTSGLIESLMHSLMGVQVGLPILLCLLFRINVLILLICLFLLVMHELVAHWDVSYASPRRKISIWEMHAHSYLATLPFFMLSMVAVINWPVVLNLISLNWQGQMSFVPMEYYHGGKAYIWAYMIFTVCVGIVPYIEENIRCLRYQLAHGKP